MAQANATPSHTPVDITNCFPWGLHTAPESFHPQHSKRPELTLEIKPVPSSFLFFLHHTFHSNVAHSSSLQKPLLGTSKWEQESSRWGDSQPILILGEPR
jgi:hypothetical protein